MKRGLLLGLLLLSPLCRADMIIETIDLYNRPAEEVTEILRPMLQPGGSLTGTGYKLIIRSTPENIEQIKGLLADIDGSITQLLISVSMDQQAISSEQGHSQSLTVQDDNVSIQAGRTGRNHDDTRLRIGNDKIKYDTRLFENRHRQQAPAMQQVRVSEGLWANIGTGQAVPIRTRQRNSDGTVTETITYQSVTSGFEVMPRVHGENVTLTIRPQRQSVSRQGGGIYDNTSMETTVTGRLNQWIRLGGVSNQTISNQGRINYSTRGRIAAQDTIWVKVERASQ